MRFCKHVKVPFVTSFGVDRHSLSVFLGPEHREKKAKEQTFHISLPNSRLSTHVFTTITTICKFKSSDVLFKKKVSGRRCLRLLT